MSKEQNKMDTILVKLPATVRQLPLKYKWMLLIVVNTLPSILNVTFYDLGGNDDLSFFLLALVCFVTVNYWACTLITPTNKHEDKKRTLTKRIPYGKMF